MMALADVYATCGPWVHPDTIAAVVAVESGGHPWAIGTPHGAYFPRTRGEATRVLARSLRSESSVDIGLMQINSQWLPDFTSRRNVCSIRASTCGLAQPFSRRTSSTPRAPVARCLRRSLRRSRLQQRLGNGAVSYVAHVFAQH